MAWTTCWKCKEQFGLKDETEALLRRSQGTFYCPWGHPAVFKPGETEEDKLRRERDRLKQDAARLEEERRMWAATAESQREQRLAAERRAAAARGQVTKLKRRAANGVCPCCSRTFANLQRHMASKHAGFLAEEVQAEVGRTIQ